MLATLFGEDTLSWFHDDTLPPSRLLYQSLPLLLLQSLYPHCFMRCEAFTHSCETPNNHGFTDLTPAYEVRDIYGDHPICPSVHLSVGLSRVNLSLVITVKVKEMGKMNMSRASKSYGILYQTLRDQWAGVVKGGEKILLTKNEQERLVEHVNTNCLAYCLNY